MNIIRHCKLLERIPFDFEPQIWKDFVDANCYAYLLNYRNPDELTLYVGSLIGRVFQPNQSNQELIETLTEEMEFLGFLVEKTTSYSEIPINTMKFFVSRSICGDYHFYRLDSNGKWSHKMAYSEPSSCDFDDNPITLPEYACSTDINLGYYFLRFRKG